MQTWGLLIEGNAEEGGLRDGKGRQVMEYWLGSGERPLTGHKKSTRKGGHTVPLPVSKMTRAPGASSPEAGSASPHTLPHCAPATGENAAKERRLLASER